MQAQAAISQTTEEFPGFADELRSYWRRLPNKAFFFLLLTAWLLLFHLLGSSSLGYIQTASLPRWMLNAYNSTSVVADDAHGNVIPLLVLGLMWWKRKKLMAGPLATWWPGLLLVLLGLFFHIVGYVLQQERSSIVGMFVGIYGLTGLAWGWRWLRASFFPFFLFAFMVPLGSLTEPVTFPLRLLVTKLVATLCADIAPLDVVSEGTRLFKETALAGAGRYEYDVAPACGGIKSLIAIGIGSIVCAFVYFRSPGKRALIIAAALPLAVLGNTVRLIFIVVAAESGGQAAGNNVHDSSVWSMLPYVPAFLGLILLIQWLERREKPPASRGQPHAEAAA